MDQFNLHEQFEMEVLTELQSIQMLDKLIFGGGTMLRLCHELNRYSVDLDFYLKDKKDESIIGEKIKSHLVGPYQIRDYMEKQNTIQIEVASPQFPKKLKIEINTVRQISEIERAIAWSQYANKQVMVNTIPLEKMVDLKIEALINRKEIRDAFDLEFLIRRGLKIPLSLDEIARIKNVITGFKQSDYKVKLGSILTVEYRKYYNENGFSFLWGHLTQIENSWRKN